MKVFYLPLQLFLTFFLLNVLVFSCQKPQKEEESSPNNAPRPEVIPLEYARLFKLESYPDYTRLVLLKPFSDRKDSLEFFLTKKGQNAPASAPPSQVISIPVQRAIVLSHTHLAFLQKLGLEDKIVGINESRYLPDPKTLQKIKSGEIMDISSTEGVLDQESILSLKPDLLLFSAGSVKSIQDQDILSQAGIAMLINSEWLESHPLGRAEWIKFMGLLFGEEEKAKQIYQNIQKDYESLVQKTQGLDPSQRPSVLWEIPYKDTWYVPGGDSYVAHLLEDAGAQYLWKEEAGKGSLAKDFESVYALGKEADYWLSLSQVKNYRHLIEKDPRFADFSAFQNQKIYNNDRQSMSNGGNPYWMEGVINPHWVLADLVKVFHPELVPQQKWRYYQALKP